MQRSRVIHFVILNSTTRIGVHPFTRQARVRFMRGIEVRGKAHQRQTFYFATSVNEGKEAEESLRSIRALTCRAKVRRQTEFCWSRRQVSQRPRNRTSEEDDRIGHFVEQGIRRRCTSTSSACRFLFVPSSSFDLYSIPFPETRLTPV